MKEKNISISDALSDRSMLDDLKKMLDEELSKPENERNYDAVKEITDTVICLTDEKIPPPQTEMILTKISERKRRRFGLIRKWTVAVSACLAVGISLNFYTLATYGENVFATVLKKARNGFTLDLSSEEEHESGLPECTNTTTAVSGNDIVTEPVTAPVSSGDTSPEYIAECILTLCQEHDINACVPKEIPPEIAYNGFFEMTESHYEPMEDSEDFSFTFANGNQQQFRITLEKYKSHKDIPEILIPSDSFEVVQENVCGTEIYVFPNDNRATAVFAYHDIMYTINGYNISADGIMKLASAFVPSSVDAKK